MFALFSRGRAGDRATMHEEPAGGSRFGRLFRSAAMVALLTVVGLVASEAVIARPASAATGCSVNVVAHPDDDLFFLNPDIRSDIVNRTCVHTMFVTSGDAGQGTSYSRNRERGIQAAYAKMAGVANLWLPVPIRVSGRTIDTSVLLMRPTVSLSFLRLPDGNPDGSGTQASGFTSLQQLYLGQVPTLKTIEARSESYTLDSVVATIGQTMRTLRATTVRTMDHLADYDEGDHSDHLTVARLAAIARASYQPSAQLIGYLGYPGTSLPANISGKDLTAKQQAFLAYAPYDSSMCQTMAACDARGDSQWLVRQHQATALHPTRDVTPGNVAPVAFVTQSSHNWAAGQQGAKAVDGRIAGYPGDATAEWATVGGGAGSWLQLNWLEPIQVDTVVLYDRPNTSDWVTGGTLTFSDGSVVTVPELKNEGGPVTVTFPARATTSLKFTATTVGPNTGNVGLAELQVWTSGSAPATPEDPTTPTTPPVPPACGTVTTPTTPTASVPSPLPAEPVNLAPAAAVQASSETTASQQLAANVVDGQIDGYPGDWTAEWATQGCGAGAWVELTWPAPVTLDRVVLFDRPNGNDQITAGTLAFSDGSTVDVPELANDGAATEVAFASRTTTSVRLAITGVSATTGSIGLAEFQAWTAAATAPVADEAAIDDAGSQEAAPAPVVDLFPNATVTGDLGRGNGSWVQLNWSQATTVGRLVITNPTRGTLGASAARLTFADGTTVDVPRLPAAGESVTVTFTPRTTTTVTITVTAVRGPVANAASATLQVFAS